MPNNAKITPSRKPKKPKNPILPGQISILSYMNKHKQMTEGNIPNENANNCLATTAGSSTTLVKGKTTEARNETGDDCNKPESGEQELKFCKK